MKCYFIKLLVIADTSTDEVDREMTALIASRHPFEAYEEAERRAGECSHVILLDIRYIK